MRAAALESVLLLFACGHSKSPVGPQSSDDGGQATSCESLIRRTTEIYERAALDEALVANLHADFVAANLHMVMVDCHAAPASVIACVNAAENAADLENDCLAPLDDSGEVEGTFFSTK
ncbi:MAG: hypothetical protein GY811_08945 [Myxococcales bacterium]|nr:hypothetical protein [Myxococcales bacterium]